MSDDAPPPVPGDAAVGPGQERLSPARIDAVLADFRAWLEQAAAASAVPPAPAEKPPDLHTLLAQFVALRHEVNLQTKATRAQQEQNAEALQQLAEALEVLRRAEEAGGRAQEADSAEQLRPVLKTLLDLHDALSLARREVLRVQEAMGPALDKLDAGAEPSDEPEPPAATPPAVAAPAKRSLWAKWFGAAPGEPRPADDRRPDPAHPWREAFARQRRQLEALRASRSAAQEAAGQARRFIDSVVTGYTMSLQRLERALQQQGLEPLPCLGQPFDPETMEVVEVVPGAGRASTEVVEEVKRGYRWRGRLFRFAQVRVAKP